MYESRKIAAILAADVVGYSRLAGADEERTLSRLRGLRKDVTDPAIAAHRGRIVKRTGDGAIVNSEASSMRCAVRSKYRTAWSGATGRARRSPDRIPQSGSMSATWSRRAMAT